MMMGDRSREQLTTDGVENAVFIGALRAEPPVNSSITWSMSQHLCQRGIFWRIVEIFFFNESENQSGVESEAGSVWSAWSALSEPSSCFMASTTLSLGRWESKPFFLFSTHTHSLTSSTLPSLTTGNKVPIRTEHDDQVPGTNLRTHGISRDPSSASCKRRGPQHSPDRRNWRNPLFSRLPPTSAHKRSLLIPELCNGSTQRA